MRRCVLIVALLTSACAGDAPATAPTPMPAHGTAAKIELSASSGLGERGGTVTVQARVLDAYAATLPAVAVAFHATAGDFSVTPVLTDGSGLARTTLTVPAGLVSIDAQAASVRADVTLTVQPLIVTPTPPPSPTPPPEPPPPTIPFTVAIAASVDTTTPHTILFGLMTQGTIVSAVWTYGDGTGTYTTTGSRAATSRHTYASAGEQPVTVTATDSRGRVASDSVGVIVP